MLFICFLILFYASSPTSSASAMKQMFKAVRQPGFENTFQTSGALETLENLLAVVCVEKCNINVKCMSFFYNSNTQKCILHSSTFWDKNPSSSEKGWKMYLLTDVTGRCSPKNGFVYNRELDLCYQLNSGVRMNYDGIIKPACAAVNAELIRIDSETKNSYIMEAVKNKFVTPNTHVCIQGQSRYYGYIRWTFDDGTDMPYFNWDKVYSPAQPDNPWGEPRVSIARAVGTWHDFATNTGFNCLFVCERR